jgi:DNA-binding CsgD family transcriptional regulator
MKKPKSPASGAESESSSSTSVLTLLRQIQSGEMHPSSLAAADRQAVVEHLTAEGYSICEIAEILKTSERTIARDRKAIRDANAVARDPKMVELMVGQLMQEAQNCISRIRRAARDKEAGPAVRVDAEHRVYQIFSDLTTRLQSLGYLPSSTQKIKAELTHQIAESEDPAVLQAEIVRLLQIEQASNPQGESQSPLQDLQVLVQHLPAPASPINPNPEKA